MKTEWNIATDVLASDFHQVHFNVKFEWDWLTNITLIDLVSALVDGCLCCDHPSCNSLNKRRKRFSKGKTATFSSHYTHILHICLWGPQRLLFSESRALPMTWLFMSSIRVFLLHSPFLLTWTGLCLLFLSHGLKSLSSVLPACVAWPHPHWTQLNPEDGNSMYSYTVIAWCHAPEDYILTKLYFVITRIFCWYMRV
jgi:hypothetical protein